jgi:hypothetical protein
MINPIYECKKGRKKHATDITDVLMYS